MSIDPKKAFGMKATNKAYTLEFLREDGGLTTVSAVDMETSRMSFSQRLSAAWSILTGKKTIGELVFPIRLRNSDFYHMSYIYRQGITPIDNSEIQMPEETPNLTAAAPEAKTKKPKTSESKSNKVNKSEPKPSKAKAPRKPKSEKPS